MIAWSVLVGLGNGIMTSMGPVLYSDAVYQGPEFGVILASNSGRPCAVAPPKHHL
jgi:hypothetical protein